MAAAHFCCDRDRPIADHRREEKETFNASHHRRQTRSAAQSMASSWMALLYPCYALGANAFNTKKTNAPPKTYSAFRAAPLDKSNGSSWYSST